MPRIGESELGVMIRVHPRFGRMSIMIIIIIVISAGPRAAEQLVSAMSQKKRR